MHEFRKTYSWRSSRRSRLVSYQRIPKESKNPMRCPERHPEKARKNSFRFGSWPLVPGFKRPLESFDKGLWNAFQTVPKLAGWGAIGVLSFSDLNPSVLRFPSQLSKATTHLVRTHHRRKKQVSGISNNQKTPLETSAKSPPARPPKLDQGAKVSRSVNFLPSLLEMNPPISDTNPQQKVFYHQKVIILVHTPHMVPQQKCELRFSHSFDKHLTTKKHVIQLVHIQVLQEFGQKTQKVPLAF